MSCDTLKKYGINFASLIQTESGFLISGVRIVTIIKSLELFSNLKTT